jgi:hypothetical protein
MVEFNQSLISKSFNFNSVLLEKFAKWRLISWIETKMCLGNSKANLQLLDTLLSWFKDSAFTIYDLTTPMHPTVERLLVECSGVSAAGDGQRWVIGRGVIESLLLM